MTRDPTWLLEYRRNVYSQTGEDGIIEKILDIIPRNDKWCVEFGAWDGSFLSNTRHLIEHKGFSAVLIEAENMLALRAKTDRGLFFSHAPVFLCFVFPIH
uniref:Methyltransferase FkbM domain-containing protein n=1 Tax=Candidatus Kentrum sp. TUN TaxID=2126343 RepID=A0A451A6K8_9GAMM|nr:MAG: hypothetical protein BECKTUN1418F_GA0071002_10832 [Candidatus Kentron sp. TUN]VFK61659.1 MAG: hypothetical protein BECKTUN1418D_GA0071000_115613 [Candidatus Kentron sp. TUN]VFK62495.1 MAG: hypothetical protein BECKTUN1418E_GA0071001_10812 [Candidatus Kentron sp. TUN]